MQTQLRNHRLFLLVLIFGGLLMLIGWVGYLSPIPLLIWLFIEALAVIGLAMLVSRYFPSQATPHQPLYRRLQAAFLRRLHRVREPYRRQMLLDQMMQEDALQQADLSRANLVAAHLESAHLNHALLMQSDLTEANLDHAELREALLTHANLRYARLNHADLHRADLTQADMQGCLLANANLSDAVLRSANLQGVSLYDAELLNADLTGGDLRGSCLIYANLQGVHLDGARFDHDTILPDGTHWQPETDLRRFTDPQHHEFMSFAGPDSEAFKRYHQQRQAEK